MEFCVAVALTAVALGLRSKQHLRLKEENVQPRRFGCCNVELCFLLSQ